MDQSFSQRLIALGKAMRAEAEVIYGRMDARSVQGGTTDDYADLLDADAKKLFKLARELENS